MQLFSKLLGLISVMALTSFAQSVTIPRNFEDVAAIIEKWDDNGLIKTHGTGFFYKDSATSTPYLITNRHLLVGHDSLQVRFNSPDGYRIRTTLNLLNSQSRVPFWRAHPDTNIDLAILPVLKTLRVRILDSPRAKPSSEVSLGDIVYFIGFPIPAVGDKVYPLLRHGVVAYVFHEETTFGDKVYPKGTILIDGTSLGGNSGGPVISLPRQGGSRASYIGVIQGHLTVGGENADLGIVIPAERLIELVSQ